MREAKLFHICLSALRHGGIDEVQGDSKGGSGEAVDLGDVRQHHSVQEQLLH